MFQRFQSRVTMKIFKDYEWDSKTADILDDVCAQVY